MAIREDPVFRAAVIDLVAWPRARSRVVEAFRRRGEDPTTVEVLPVLGRRGWASFGAAWCWWPTGTSVLTPAAVARIAAEPIVDPSIGSERLGAVTSFGSEALALQLQPDANRLSNWTEAIARNLHRAERSDTGPRSVWTDLYDDLPIVFPGATGRALAGRHIILGEAKELLAAWSDAPPKGVRRAHPGVFFARSALDDAAVDATEDGRVPRSLRRVLARVHPDLDWLVRSQAVRRNRPGRIFLEDQGLVRVARVEDLLRIVERVLRATRSPAVWRDALVFVYRITRPGPRRPDLRTLGLERLGLRSPGWRRVGLKSPLLLRAWVDAVGGVIVRCRGFSQWCLC